MLGLFLRRIQRLLPTRAQQCHSLAQPDGDDFRRLFRDRTVALGTLPGRRPTRHHGHADAILLPRLRGCRPLTGHQQKEGRQPRNH